MIPKWKMFMSTCPTTAEPESTTYSAGSTKKPCESHAATVNKVCKVKNEGTALRRVIYLLCPRRRCRLKTTRERMQLWLIRSLVFCCLKVLRHGGRTSLRHQRAKKYNTLHFSRPVIKRQNRSPTMLGKLDLTQSRVPTGRCSLLLDDPA